MTDANTGVLRAAVADTAAVMDQLLPTEGRAIEAPWEDQSPMPRISLLAQFTPQNPTIRKYILENRHSDFISALARYSKHYDFILSNGAAYSRLMKADCRNAYGDLVFAIPVAFIPPAYKLMEFLMDMKLTYPVPTTVMTVTFFDTAADRCGYLTLGCEGHYHEYTNRHVTLDTVGVQAALRRMERLTETQPSRMETFKMEEGFVSKIHFDPTEIRL